MEFYRQTVKESEILLLGQSVYISKVRNQQNDSGRRDLSNERSLETNTLPLIIRENYIGNKLTEFPAGSGALLVIKSNLLVMSRFGDFFIFDRKISKANIKSIPNLLDLHILNRSTKPVIDVMRANYAVFDETTNQLFVSYTRYANKKQNEFCVASISIDPVAMSSVGAWREIYVSQRFSEEYPSLAAGGRMLLRGGELYFAVGYADGDEDLKSKVPASQNSSSSFGKIFKYNIEKDLLKLVSLGHRNIQGMAITSENHLLATEHGPHAVHELSETQSYPRC